MSLGDGEILGKGRESELRRGTSSRDENNLNEANKSTEI